MQLSQTTYHSSKMGLVDRCEKHMINTKYIVIIDDDEQVWKTAVKYFDKACPL